MGETVEGAPRWCVDGYFKDKQPEEADTPPPGDDVQDRPPTALAVVQQTMASVSRPLPFLPSTDPEASRSTAKDATKEPPTQGIERRGTVARVMAFGAGILRSVRS